MTQPHHRLAFATAALLNAGLLLGSFPGEVKAGPQCAPFSVCASTCPSNLDAYCQSQRPGCDPLADSDCTYWTTQCWGTNDNIIECTYAQ